MVKPFSIKEFLARVRAIARTMSAGKQKKLTFIDLELDTENLSIKSENSVGLSNKEVDGKKAVDYFQDKFGDPLMFQIENFQQSI